MGLTDYTISDKKYWQAGRDYERDRIIKRIQERVGELRSCHKSDNCQEFASLIESYIEEWTEGQHPPQQFRDRSNGE
jgi:hypothetical protein